MPVCLDLKESESYSVPFRMPLVSKLTDREGNWNILGPLGGGAQIDEITTNYEKGSLVRTGEDSDLALFGEGFFHMETPAGERLTRNGSFMRDSEGWIVNSNGHYLLGEKGRIQIPENEFDVSSTGEVYVHREVATPEGRRIDRTVEIDRLKVSQPGSPESLERLGDSLYFLPSPDLQPVSTEGVRVGQGYLEMANVNAIEESIQLVDTFRSYEASQRLIRAIDDTLDQAINQVGR